MVIPVGPDVTGLDEQLGALVSQCPPGGAELIVSCNGSDLDAVDLLLAPCRGRGWSCRAVDSSAVRGPAHARNAGWRAGRSEVVLFCDADDVVAADWVAVMADAVRRHGIAGSRLTYDALNAPALARTSEVASASLPTKFRHRPYAPSCSLGISRALLDALDGFDEELPCGEDIDLCWRAAAFGAPVTFVANTSVQYRLRVGTLPVFRQTRAYARHDRALLRRHRPSGAVWTAADELREFVATSVALVRLPRGGALARRTAAARLGALVGRVEALLIR